jgi:hypothetical protein
MNSIQFNDEVNDSRSNIIEVLLRLLKQFDDTGEEIHLTHENKELHYVPKKGLWLEGCADRVHVKDYRYASVSLGNNIRSYNHLPYYWLRSLLKEERP